MIKKQINQDVLALVSAIFGVLAVGTLVFSYLEHWSLLNALYFVTMTATTVGYGDFTPSTPISKIMTIIYAISIVPFILYAFSAIAKSQVEKVYTKIHHLERKQKEQEQEISDAERKLRRQKTLIKQQEEALGEQQMEIKSQSESMREQDKELEIVEDIMEEALVG